MASKEDQEDNTEDEEIMVDSAIRLSLQTAVSNGAGTSSGRTSGPSPAAVLRAAAAERRLARNKRALARAIEKVNEEEDVKDEDEAMLDSDSQSVLSLSGSESEEEPLAKATKKKPVTVRSKAVFSSFQELRELRKNALELRKELKKEERALMAKLGRRLTPVRFHFLALERP